MATQKKTGGSRSASGGRRTASSSKSKGGSRKQTAQPYRREMGAVACLLLAIFSLFGCFDIKAIFISFFCDLLKVMMGYGFWLVPPALLLGAFILEIGRAHV